MSFPGEGLPLNYIQILPPELALAQSNLSSERMNYFISLARTYPRDLKMFDTAALDSNLISTTF